MMNKRMIVFLSVIIFCSPIMSFAQENSCDDEIFSLNIRQVVDMAFEASEDLKIQKNEVLRKKAQYAEERSDLLPQINAEGLWAHNFEYPYSPLLGDRDHSLDVGVSVEQTIFSFGKIRNAVNAAKKEIEVSRSHYEVKEQEIVYNAKLAYYSAYLAKRTLDIFQESYTHALEHQNILKERSQGARVSRHDNIKVSADLASRLPMVHNAQATFNSAMETLKVIIGVEGPAQISLEEGFPQDYETLEREPLVLSLYHRQPMIKALDKTIQEKEFWVRSKRAAFFPVISWFATWNHQGEGRSYYVGSRHLDDYGVVGVKVQVPIWTGGETKAKWQQAQIDHENAKLLYRQGQEAYLLELDKALSEYQSLVNTLSSHQEAIRWAQESFILSQEMFRSGQISVADLNDSEWLLTNGKINQENTLFQLNVLLARIERLTLRGENE